MVGAVKQTVFGVDADPRQTAGNGFAVQNVVINKLKRARVINADNGIVPNLAVLKPRINKAVIIAQPADVFYSVFLGKLVGYCGVVGVDNGFSVRLSLNERGF